MSAVFGFVGLGAMGIPMSGRLLDAGYDIVGFDLNKDRVKEFENAADEASPHCKPWQMRLRASFYLCPCPRSSRVSP